MFDFGPLLSGKDAEKRSDPEFTRQNGEQFRITNTGLFPLRARMQFKSDTAEEQDKPESTVFYAEPKVGEKKS